MSSRNQGRCGPRKSHCLTGRRHPKLPDGEISGPAISARSWRNKAAALVGLITPRAPFSRKHVRKPDRTDKVVLRLFSQACWQDRFGFFWPDGKQGKPGRFLPWHDQCSWLFSAPSQAGPGCVLLRRESIACAPAAIRKASDYCTSLSMNHARPQDKRLDRFPGTRHV